MQILEQLQQQRNYFNTGITQSYAFRKEQLHKLKKAIVLHEEVLYEALNKDLKKSKEESWVTELGMVLSELKFITNHLRSWMEAEPVSTNLVNMPSSSKLMSEPLGVVLIIGPWNYPFQLLFNPLIGAIAAGNCIALKPSEFAAATDAVMHKIISSTFESQYISYHSGDGATIVPEMMNNFRFDHVFYTGSTTVGKIIYKMAAEHLVPTTLELGGKSPCIVDASANIKVAAKRIAVTKFSNCGQMCVAPDYVLVHESKKEELIAALQNIIPKFFNTDVSTSYNYGKIINAKQFDRLITYLQQGKIVYGGHTNKEQLYIEPTIVTDVDSNGTIMKDEIFGPILPILTYSNEQEALTVISKNPNPLAFYVFTNSSKKEKFWLSSVPFGGGCVNNASWHLTNHHLPFGGRGFSGTGNYHGKFSFDIFSHKKAIMKTPTWFDPSIKYPPFKGKLKIFKWLIR
jgi:aldehyde dehydrogenase (NAD+)